jgi:hypothetical protein
MFAVDFVVPQQHLDPGSGFRQSRSQGFNLALDVGERVQ